jgi:nicotinate phosphoribosyltransferase
MLNITATYTDQYQLAMAQVYFQNGQRETTAVFDYFFRKLPFRNGYAIFAGLENLLEILEDLRFSDADIEFLKKQEFSEEFIEYLRNFKFRGTIYSAKEGDLVFPTRPVLQVEATMIEAQIIETMLLNILNFQTLIATKASRMRQQMRRVTWARGVTHCRRGAAGETARVQMGRCRWGVEAGAT